MNSIPGSTSPQTVMPTMFPPDTAQIIEEAMADLKEPEEKLEEYWAFGERYWFTAARPDLRLDDERNYKSESPKVVKDRQQMLIDCNVKVRDFAFASNNPKAQSCRCRLTAMRRSEWNKILKFHGMKEMDVHIPQQIIAKAPRSQPDAPTQPNSAAATQLNSPAPTQPNSPDRTEPPSPSRTLGPSAFRTQGLSRQPNAADLASALAAVNNETPTSDTSPIDGVEITMGILTAAPLAGTPTLHREDALTAPIYRGDASTEMRPETLREGADDPCGEGCVVEVPTEPSTPTPSTHVPLPAPVSISAMSVSPSILPAARSLSRLVFGGDSPLTSWSGTPSGSNIFPGDSLKRKRSVGGLGRAAASNNELRRVSGEKIKDEITRSKKRARKAVEPSPQSTRATRSSSKKTPTAKTPIKSVKPGPSPLSSTRVRPTTSVRLSRAAAAALATPSKVKQAVLGKLTKAKAKVTGKRQGRT